MSLRYSGPATLRTDSGAFDVEAVLSTNTSDGTYSWGGRLTCSDVAALRTAKQGGTLTLSVPGEPAAEVHVVLAEPADSGVLLRITGAGRAPYEQRTPGFFASAPGDGTSIAATADQILAEGFGHCSADPGHDEEAPT